MQHMPEPSPEGSGLFLSEGGGKTVQHPPEKVTGVEAGVPDVTSLQCVH